MTLPTFVAERRAVASLLLGAGARLCRSIGPTSCPLGAQQQTRRTPRRLSTDRQTDRQTDGWTDADRYIDPALLTMRAVSTNSS